MSMALNHNRVMFARLSAFVIWALVAATAVFWGLKLLVRAPAPPPYALAVGDATTVRGDLTRLLGTGPVEAGATTPTAPEASSRFQLLGVVAPKYATGLASTGVALMTVDGKMAKAYQVGAKVDGDLILQSVGLRSASIGAVTGAASVTLELPPLTSASTGNLPPAATEGPQPPRAVVTPPSANSAPNVPVVPPISSTNNMKPYVPARNAPGAAPQAPSPAPGQQQFQADPSVAVPPQAVPPQPAPSLPPVSVTPITAQ
jgi:general secretion pathway protein C